MELFFQLTTTGFLNGLIYGLLGLSWLIIFRTTGVFHLAHGLSYTVAAYGAVLFTVYIAPILPLAILAGAIAATGLGTACEALVYAPLRRRGGITLTLFLSALGILTAGSALVQMIFGPGSRRLSVADPGVLIVGSVAASWAHIFAALGCGALTVAVITFLKFTQIGKEIRATAANLELAELSGIRSRRIQLAAFALGSAVLGVPAALAALYDAANPNMGFEAVLFAFVAIFLGGEDSLWGPAVGGLAVGLVGQLSSLWLPTYWQTTVGMMLFIVVLTLKPSGLLGRGTRRSGRWNIGFMSRT